MGRDTGDIYAGCGYIEDVCHALFKVKWNITGMFFNQMLAKLYKDILLVLLFHFISKARLRIKLLAPVKYKAEKD